MSLGSMPWWAYALVAAVFWAALSSLLERRGIDLAGATGTLLGVLWMAAVFGGIGYGIYSAIDGGGDSSTTAAASFCDSHTCISSFDEGTGSIVECADGMWSHSGSHQGACSGHGGER